MYISPDIIYSGGSRSVISAVADYSTWIDNLIKNNPSKIRDIKIPRIIFPHVNSPRYSIGVIKKDNKLKKNPHLIALDCNEVSHSRIARKVA